MANSICLKNMRKLIWMHRKEKQVGHHYERGLRVFLPLATFPSPLESYLLKHKFLQDFLFCNPHPLRNIRDPSGVCLGIFGECFIERLNFEMSVTVTNKKYNFCSSVKPGSLLIDTSTIEPAVAKEMGEIVQGKGATFLDAPVSGGEVSCNPQHLNISMHVLLTALCGDHFLCFHNLHVWFRGNIVRINLC